LWCGRSALPDQFIDAGLHPADEDGRNNGVTDEAVDVRNDLENAICRCHAAQITRRKSVECSLFINAQAQPPVGKKYPVEIEKRDKAETNCLASGRVVGPDSGKFTVHQVQPDKRENAACEIMQKDGCRDREMRQLMEISRCGSRWRSLPGLW